MKRRELFRSLCALPLALVPHAAPAPVTPTKVTVTMTAIDARRLAAQVMEEIARQARMQGLASPLTHESETGERE